jgi:hypothetical protein
MIKKAMRAVGHEALYLSAINTQSLKHAANFVRGIGNLLE